MATLRTQQDPAQARRSGLEAPWISDADCLTSDERQIERKSWTYAIWALPCWLIAGMVLCGWPLFGSAELAPAVLGLTGFLCLGAAGALKRREVYLARTYGTRRRELSADHRTEWLVDVDYVYDGLITGRDRGMLWHQESVLYFSGTRSSFALSRRLMAEHKAQSYWPRPFRPMERHFTIRLNPLMAGRDRSVQFSVVPTVSQISESSRLLQVFRSMQNLPPAEELGQLPPSQSGPGAASFGFLLTAMLPALSVLLLRTLLVELIALIAFSMSLRYPDIPAALIVVGILSLLYCPELALCFRALRARAHLKRLESHRPAYREVPGATR